jgi:hypothetical protein
MAAASRDAPPAPVRRLDYRPPAFLVDAIELRFDLDPDAGIIFSMDWSTNWYGYNGATFGLQRQGVTALRSDAGAIIEFAVSPEIRELMQTLPGVARVYTLKDEGRFSGCDYWTLVGSLPHRLGADIARLAAPGPYLSADPARRAIWRARLAGLPARLRVGLVWGGRPSHENDHRPTKGEQDLMYGSGNSVNPIVNFTREGLTVWGNRTLQRGDAPLSRMDVRLLVNNVRRGLTSVLRNFVFEPNDRILWSQVKASIDPFLADIQSRRGLVRYVTIIDENNNTAERIDRGELWISVILVPNRAAEFVVLNIGVTRQNVSLTSEEIIAQL